MVEILALSASLFWGLSYIFTRVGLRGSNPFTAVLITSICSLSVSLILALITVPIDPFMQPAIIYYIAAGFLGPCISRFLLYIGIDRVGASIAVPLSEIKPLFAAIAAVLILGERLFTSIALGTILIILGVVTISLKESGGLIEKRWSKRDLIFPILAGVCFGILHVLRKMGLNGIPVPVAGVTMQNASALVFFPLLGLTQRGRHRLVLNDKRAWVIFSLAGLSMFMAQVCVFSALDLGQVIVVSPLSSLSPFFVLLLVRAFLRGLEKVTWRIVLGVILTVGGTAVLTLLP
jgi:DME family drug/metabolite transporter